MHKNVLNNCQISKDEREKYIDIILLNDTPDKTIEKLNNEIEDFFLTLLAVSQVNYVGKLQQKCLIIIDQAYQAVSSWS